MSQGNQYLTFNVGKEFFGLDINSVHEIVSHDEITHIPMLPPHIPGVINLRDTAVPVIDLNYRFNNQPIALTKRTAIIIVDLILSSRQAQIGLLVDSVSEVVNIAEKDIEPRPEFSSTINTDFINGITKLKNRFVIILNMQEVLNFEDIEYIRHAKKAGESLLSVK